jgi:UDP-N-acetyl-D-mannosaminuronate dehydrogenase
MPIDRRSEFFKGAQLKVAIIGCGYVGLPLALRFAEAGHRVTGFDTDPNRMNMLNAGRSYIEHIPQTKIQQFVTRDESARLLWNVLRRQPQLVLPGLRGLLMGLSCARR